MFNPIGTQEAAEILGISPRKVRALIEDNRITGYRMGPRGHWMVDKDEVVLFQRGQN